MPLRPLRLVNKHRSKIIMPQASASRPPSMHASASSLDSLSSNASQPQSDSAIYIGTVKHIHHYYGKEKRPKRQAGLQSGPPQLDSRPSWVQQGERFAKKLQPLAQIMLAVLIFCASRVSLGFGVRLNGND